jgi:hypothetical protein
VSPNSESDIRLWSIAGSSVNLLIGALMGVLAYLFIQQNQNIQELGSRMSDLRLEIADLKTRNGQVVLEVTELKRDYSDFVRQYYKKGHPEE